MLLLFLDTGIRPAEALALEIPDIRLQAQEIFVRGEIAKSGISRTLPITKPVVAALMRLMSVNDKYFDDNYVFYSSIGGPLVHNSWRLRLDVYGEKLGIRIAPYDLRHTFAVMYLRAGGDAFSLQRIMGHADMEMTKHYTSLNQQDIEKRHNAASPLNLLITRGKRIRNI